MANNAVSLSLMGDKLLLCQFLSTSAARETPRTVVLLVEHHTGGFDDLVTFSAFFGQVRLKARLAEYIFFNFDEALCSYCLLTSGTAETRFMICLSVVLHSFDSWLERFHALDTFR
jgi:hypothetical protein